MVRRLREAGYVIPIIPLLVGGQAIIWLTWPYHAGGALAGFGATVVVCMFWRLFMQDAAAARSTPAGSSSNYLRDVSATLFLAAWVPLFASFGALLVYAARRLRAGVLPDGRRRGSDIGGYAVGALFGKHPMVPAISPKKSWEGFAGSLVFGITAAILTATFLAGKPAWVGALLGLILVLTCTLGDLVESQVKRDLGIKDMGRLLPGHGGLMDRLDGVLPSAVRPGPCSHCCPALRADTGQVMVQQLVFEEPRAGKPPRHLADLDAEGRASAVAELGLPAFRAKQLAHQYYGRLIADPRQMTDLPAAVRDVIAEAMFPNLLTAAREISCDAGQTRKTLWRRRRWHHLRIGADALPAAQHRVYLLAGRLRHGVPVLRHRPGRA